MKNHMRRKVGPVFWRLSRLIVIALMAGFILTACSGEGSFRSEPQIWKDIGLIVEYRPYPLRAGMSEFWVVARKKDGKPAHDLIVSVSIEGRGGLRQGIQDGHTGVFRRAIAVPAGSPILLVHIKRKDDGTVMRFPLEVSP